ncbi:MAG: hypothetical protein ABW210_14625, partial [Achromobacter sp.]
MTSAEAPRLGQAHSSVLASRRFVQARAWQRPAYQLGDAAHITDAPQRFRYVKLFLGGRMERMMAIDFTLTSYQRRLQKVAREFSNEILAPLVRHADEEPDPQKAFEAVKAAYVESYKLGFATGFIP